MLAAQRGLTLIELTTVMVVMAVVAALAAPALMDQRSMQATGVQSQLVGMLRHAQKTALSQARPVCVSLVNGPPRQVELTYALGAACGGGALSEPGSTSPFVFAVPSAVTWLGPIVLRFGADGRPVPNLDQSITVGGRVVQIRRETGLVH